MLVHTNPHFWATFAAKRRRKIQTGDFSSAIKGYLFWLLRNVLAAKGKRTRCQIWLCGNLNNKRILYDVT